MFRFPASFCTGAGSLVRARAGAAKLLTSLAGQEPKRQGSIAAGSTAMIALKQGKGSFADAIILALGARAGCSYTLTFDGKASRLSGFRLA